MYRKLNLDRDKVAACRALVERIFAPVFRFVEHHSTLSIEAASLALCGVAQPEKVLAQFSRDQLRRGTFSWLLRLMQAENCTLLLACEKVLHKKITWEQVPELQATEVKHLSAPFCDELCYQLEVNRNVQQALSRRYFGNRHPLKALSIACAPSQELETQVAEILELHAGHLDQLHCHFADLSLTQASENFAKLRQLADEHAHKFNRYVCLAVSLQFPSAELAAASAKQRIEILQTDLLHDVLFGKVHARFAAVEHAFIRALAAKAGTSILSREAEAASQMDVYRYGHQTLSTMLLSDNFARHYQMNPEAVMLSHAFQLSPDIEDAWLFELAEAQLLREHFTKNPLVLRSDYFHHSLPAHFYEAGSTLARLISFISEQSILELRAEQHLQANIALQLKQIDYFAKTMRTAGDELTMNHNGKISRRAHTVLENAERQLHKMEQVGFFDALTQRVLQGGEVKSNDQLIGAELYFQKDRSYQNPVWDMLKSFNEEEGC